METNKRPDSMARINTPELAQAFIDEQVAALRAQVGDKKVLLALSGGWCRRWSSAPSPGSWCACTSTTA